MSIKRIMVSILFASLVVAGGFTMSFEVACADDYYCRDSDSSVPAASESLAIRSTIIPFDSDGLVFWGFV